MTLEEIKVAVGRGDRVCWVHEGYVVEQPSPGYFLVRCIQNDHAIGLTWLDGKTMNGEEKDFFIDSGEEETA